MHRIYFQRITNSLVLVFGCLILFLGDPSHAISASYIGKMTNQNPEIVEYLRVSVPAEQKDAWIFAEKRSWENWLPKQTGFLGRQIFWEEKTQEGVLLIAWAKKANWKEIPKKEIADVQESFEQLAREATGETKGNPFPLTYEGELIQIDL